MLTIETLIKELHEDNCSCVIANNGVKRCFFKRGVMDLYEVLVNEPDFLNGALVADKVVGKGAAALMCLGKVKKMYADIISESALSILVDNSIEVTYNKCVTNIINRDHSDLCPVEKLCMGEDDLHLLFERISKFVQSINEYQS